MNTFRYAVVLLPLTLATTAYAGEPASWATFIDETATRLVADSAVGQTNPDEKDYAWGDLDQDGDIDLVAVYKEPEDTTGRRRNVLFMNEDGVLVDRTADYAANSWVMLQGGAPSQGMLDLTNDRDVVVVDVNGDGWLDVVTSTTLSGGLGKAISHPRVYINLKDFPLGSGDWQGLLFDNEDRVPTMPDEPRFIAVAAGDVDGDGDADLYFADSNNGPYVRTVDLNDRLWINQGNGYFTDESAARLTPEVAETSMGHAVELVDFNDDDRLDILRSQGIGSDARVTIAYNNLDSVGPDGFFDEIDEAYTFSSYFVSSGDLNVDGVLDLIITDDFPDFFQLGTGIDSRQMAAFTDRLLFTGSESQFGGNNLDADLDLDGLPDVLIANFDLTQGSCNQPSKVYHNLGFQPDNFTVDLVEEGTVGIAPDHLKGVHDFGVFDLNGDTLPDIVIGNCAGTRVYINTPTFSVTYAYPLGLPGEFSLPNTSRVIRVEPAFVGPLPPEIVSGSLVYSIDGGAWITQPLTRLTGGLFESVLPSIPCASSVAFYVTFDLNDGTTITDPPDAPADVHRTFAAFSVETEREDFETLAVGWTVQNDPSLTGGGWEQDKPFGTSIGAGPVAPDDDAQDDGQIAFVTENGVVGGAPGDADVDGGPTRLLTPVMDLSGAGDAEIRYHRWFHSHLGVTDSLIVEASNDGGASWHPVEVVSESTDAWVPFVFRLADVVPPSGMVQLRFSVADEPNDSQTEAGIDLFEVTALNCPQPVPCPCGGDVTGDNLIDARDIAGYLDCQIGGGPGCECANLDFEPGVQVGEVSQFVALLLAGAGC